MNLALWLNRAGLSDPQRPALQSPQLAKLSFGRAFHAEQLTSALVQRASSSGEPDGSARSVEQIDVELTLELRVKPPS